MGHVLTILTFLAYLPRSKHLHIFTAAVNVWFGRTRARRPARAVALRRPEDGARGGAPLRRRHDRGLDLEGGARHVLVHRVRSLPGRLPGVRDRQGAVAEARDHGAARPGVRAATPRRRWSLGAVPEESVWDCVTCGACVQACPVSIEHIDHIVDLRRHLVMVESSFPAEAEPMLRDVERASNPWGRAQSERADWAASLGVRVLEPGDPAPEYLYWVGCAASFDERRQARGRVNREAAEGRRRRLRDPGAARELHRRPGSADGQRVRLPGVRRAERRRRSTRPA